MKRLEQFWIPVAQKKIAEACAPATRFFSNTLLLVFCRDRLEREDGINAKVRHVVVDQDI